MGRQKTQHTQAAPKLARDIMQGSGSKKSRNVSGGMLTQKVPATHRCGTSTSIRARFCSFFWGQSSLADLDLAKILIQSFEYMCVS